MIENHAVDKHLNSQNIEENKLNKTTILNECYKN